MNKTHSPKKTAKGTELPLIDLKGKPYLQVAYRIVWFREEHPQGNIVTEIIKLEEDYAIVKATVYDTNHRCLGSGHKKEYFSNFGDYIEKAETGAIGRALALSGYGTQFEPDLDEGLRLSDSPIIPVSKPKGKSEDERVESTPRTKASQADVKTPSTNNAPNGKVDSKPVSKNLGKGDAVTQVASKLQEDLRTLASAVKNAGTVLNAQGKITIADFKKTYGIPGKVEELEVTKLQTIYNQLKTTYPELGLGQ